jgi:UDP-N-acetylmuramoylalanine--D-glutamate ligase
MILKPDWAGGKVAVIGLGIEGEDLARYFAGHGAAVTVLDAKDRAAIGDRAGALEALGVNLALGSNDPVVIEGAELVCVSQGVPQTNPAVVAAHERGVPVESMTSLFFANCPGPIAGITGSSGKTTTTFLTEAIFAAAGRKHVFGGNLGVGLLNQLDGLDAETWAVLEVSHTQLVLLDESPHVACLTNVTPNHLDQFSWEDYVGLKRRIFAFQSSDDYAVFNADDPVSREIAPSVKARTLLFSARGDHGRDGAFLQDGAVYWRRDGDTERVVGLPEIPLRGAHNVKNVLAATAVAAACGIDAAAVAKAVRGFKAPPHRLELVATIGGVAYYNDSIATTPERTLAGLRSFDQPVVLLLGGREKKLPLDSLTEEISKRCRAVVCFGEAGNMLADAMARAPLPVERVDTLAEAVNAAAGHATPGDIVLLSPACTSFDAYPNFERRGEEFRRLVAELAVAREVKP